LRFNFKSTLRSRQWEFDGAQRGYHGGLAQGETAITVQAASAAPGPQLVSWLAELIQLGFPPNT
jgi:hypothetical protein